MFYCINRLILISIITVAMVACASYDFRRMQIQQGNLLPNQKVTKIRTGMSKEQVASIIGDSLLQATFTNNRWDYAYTYRVGNGPMTQKRLVLKFKNNRLVSKTS